MLYVKRVQLWAAGGSCSAVTITLPHDSENMPTFSGRILPVARASKYACAVSRRPKRPLNRMRIKVSALASAVRSETIFLPLHAKTPLSEEAFFSHLPAATQKIITSFAVQEFRGEEGEVKSIWLPDGPVRRAVLFGLGAKENWHERKLPLVARRLVQYAKKERIKEFACPLPLFDDNAAPQDATRPVRDGSALRALTVSHGARIFTTNALMAEFEYHFYKTTPKEGWPSVTQIHLGVDISTLADAKKGATEGMIIGEETNACRRLANTPGGDMTPQVLAEEAITVAKRYGIKVRVLDETAMKALGMGAVLGVAAGSLEKPKFIILEYLKGPQKQKPLVLAGKGVTFDSGGVNIKPEAYMYEMHMDMSGGAAVIHGLAAIARLKLPLNIIGLVPAVENMPSGSSYRPGDLLKSLSGKTIEVLNTDAEGRVILADALTYALRYKPGFIVDIATLTGAAHVALGNYCSAVFSNREKLLPALVQIGADSGDYLWPLPLWDEYLADIKGVFGDFANTGRQDRYGGAIHGAKFLEQFVDKTPWAHLDIAPKMTTLDSEYLAKGASGVGVRYIVELAKAYPNLQTKMSKSR